MSRFAIPSETHIGHVHLQFSELEVSRDFYVDLLGFKPVSLNGNLEDSLALSADGNLPLHLILSRHPNARPKPPNSTGLFHLAIRLPNRKSLAQIFQHLITNNYPIQGFSDHKVSEALYLADPAGNGLELYRDRPREQWPQERGQIAMRTDPLDVHDLLAEAQGDPSSGTRIHPQSDIGHIHLQVSDLSTAEDFYHNLLGLEVTQRTYPGALFFSAGGYHHHVGANIWVSRGGPPAPDDAIGLISFSLSIPDGNAWSTLIKRVQEAGYPVENWLDYGDFLSAMVRDPFGNGVEFVVLRSQVEGDILDTLG